MLKLATETMVHQIRQFAKQLFLNPVNTIPIEVVRIGLGFLLLFNYGMYSAEEVLFFYGNNGLIPPEYVPWIYEWRQFSVLALLSEDWQILVFHYFFLFLCLCLFLGWHTRWVKWLVLIAHLGYYNRTPYLAYGVDSTVIALLIPLCIAPIGSALSLDRVRAVRLHKKKFGLNSRPKLPTSAVAFGCLRLIQIQMAVMYFSSGIEKLYGDAWWSGEAPWIAMINHETAFAPMGIFAGHFWLVNLLAYGTLMTEIGYAFLIWGRQTRPYFLIAALLLHVGIALFLGMYYFALVMIFGHLAFFRHKWYRAIGSFWSGHLGQFQMIYDGNCGFCKRSMAAFLAFDGLSQINSRNYHTDPSPVVSREQSESAINTVTGDGTTYSGFYAYRHVVLRVPGLWWLVLIFYIPLLSRGIGDPVYRWIASNRMVVSKYV